MNIVAQYKKVVLLSLILLFSLSGLFAQSDYKIKGIKIEGNTVLDDAFLKEQMNTRTKTFTQKLLFWKKFPRFSSYVFNDDIERLKESYQRNGVLFPEIDYSLDKSDKAKTIKILIAVKESNPVIINQITVSDSTSSDKVTSIINESKKEITVKNGDRFEDGKINSTELLLENSLADRGYPFAKVEKSITLLEDNAKANVDYSVSSGPFTYFGETYIKSDSSVPESFIRNQLKYKKGEQFSKDLLAKTQLRLYGTELFQYVVVHPLRDSLRDDHLPILIQMKEKPRWSLVAGGGYGTEDRLRFSLDVTKRQFFGGARRFIFKGKHSYFLPISFEAQFIQPDFLRDNLDLVLNPFFIRENEMSYEVQRLGGGVTFQQSISSSLSAYITYSMEVDDFTYKKRAVGLIAPTNRPYNKAGLTSGFDYSTADDLFDPTKGAKINGYISWMGIGFNSLYHYWKFETTGRKYIDLGNNWTFAGKLSTGVVQTIRGDSITPIEDRFMLGGALSLRGWGRNQIAVPNNNAGAKIGGNTMFETSLELRFPVYDIFSGVLFTDAGNVWKDSFHYDFASLHYDIGLGLRVKTPIGPIRVDYATRVFEGQFKGALFISIGQAF